jgi:hypothetical protein
MNTDKTLSSAAVIAVAAFLIGGSMQSAEAAFTTASGYDAAATIKGAVRYRNFNSSGGKEVYVDSPNLIFNADLTCCADGANNDITYGTLPQTWAITFEYDGTDLKSVATKSTTTVTTTKSSVGDLGSLNYLAFETNIGNAARNVEIQSVTVYKGATNLGTVWAASGTSAGLHQLYATGEDLTGGFKVTVNLVITGSPQPGGDSNYVQMRVGYLASDDDKTPIVSNVHLTPAIPLINGSVDVDANVDDTNRGDSTIHAARYELNNDPAIDMAASDSTFDDDISEDVTATIDPLDQIGKNTVCVIGEDSAGNISGTTAGIPVGHVPCLDFKVEYDFYGFYSPVDIDILNMAKAGQAIPFKWRLLDGDGNPISDTASFVNLRSYQTNCDEGAANLITDSVEEYAGNSGLQYNGDGYWQFNWKTPKNYADTCRSVYVELQGGQISPVVVFKFKK